MKGRGTDSLLGGHLLCLEHFAYAFHLILPLVLLPSFCIKELRTLSLRKQLFQVKKARSCSFRQTSNLYSGPPAAKASDDSIALPQCSTWSGILRASSAGPTLDLIFGQCKIMEGVNSGLFSEGIKKQLTSGQWPQEGPHQRVLREEGRNTGKEKPATQSKSWLAV